jgi:hypothetical protein
MVGDKKYNRIKKIRDDVQARLGSNDFANNECGDAYRFLGFLKALLELYALPKDVSQDLFHAKAVAAKALLKDIRNPAYYSAEVLEDLDWGGGMEPKDFLDKFPEVRFGRYGRGESE